MVLTPLPENSEDAIEKIHRAWSSCGGRTVRMSPEQHDSVLAAVSHLPHLLAFALVHEVAGRENSAELFSFAAGGFRDFTRIASSQPEMWRDISIANHRNLARVLGVFIEDLQEFRLALEKDDRKAIEEFFTQAKQRRDQWSGPNNSPE